MSQPASQRSTGAESFFDDAVEQLRAAGLRVTPQRRAILELFDHRHTHMTPQGIFEALQQQVSSLSLATVYNSLEVFEEIGVLNRVCAKDGQAYFDPNTQPHQHAVCQRCGEIFDIQIPSSKLDGLVQSLCPAAVTNGDFEIDSVDIWLKGLCSNCQ